MESSRSSGTCAGSFGHGWNLARLPEYTVPFSDGRSGEGCAKAGVADVLVSERAGSVWRSERLRPRFFAPAAKVGFFASSEKISKAVYGLLNPLREALYPRLSNMVHRSSDGAANLARLVAMVTVAGGLALGAGLFVFAPLIVKVVLGPGFSGAIPVMRILSMLPPIIAITDSIGLQWLLPRGKDGVVNRIVFSGGLLNLALACLLAPRFAHVGMAWGVVFSEAVVCAWMVSTVRRSESFGVDRPVVLAASGHSLEY